jgi:hypothetical protein
MLELKADLIKTETRIIYGKKVKVKIYSPCYLKVTNTEYDRAAWNRQAIDTEEQYTNFKTKAGKTKLYTPIGG